eukprot:Sspe_Gene.27961::Locus_12404_Transcript_1_1_Confidence_1.000_Length_4108::g.27961::m.27961
MLAGTVDPKLTPGDVKCTECNRKCSEKQVAGSDGSTICNDAPALGRVTWNPCNGNVVAVTDAGPQQACGNGAFAVPAPKFTPSMVRFQLKEEGQEIVDAAWQPLGFANGLATKASDRTLQDSCSAGSALTPDPKGLDLGDVTMLGEHFVGGDHYGPKLVVWNKDGTILARRTCRRGRRTRGRRCTRCCRRSSRCGGSGPGSRRWRRTTTRTACTRA